MNKPLERTDIGSVIKVFDVPTIDPRNFDDYLLSIFTSEDDRTEIIDGDAFETKMVFTATNTVHLPDLTQLGRIRHKWASHSNSLYTLSFEPSEHWSGDDVAEMLITHDDKKFDFEISIFKAWLVGQKLSTSTKD